TVERNPSEDANYDWEQLSTTPEQYTRINFDISFGITTNAQSDIHNPLGIVCVNILKEDKKLETGEHNVVISGNISISKWKDRGNKSASVLSTLHNPTKITHVLRTQKNSSREPVTCLESVANYHFDQ
ncbi:hypothetical protein ILUMI_11140, partial [Ignelater luminosus]